MTKDIDKLFFDLESLYVFLEFKLIRLQFKQNVFLGLRFCTDFLLSARYLMNGFTDFCFLCIFWKLLKSSKNDIKKKKNVGLKKKIFWKNIFSWFLFFWLQHFFSLSYHFLSFLKAFRKCNKNKNLLIQSWVIGLKGSILSKF